MGSNRITVLIYEEDAMLINKWTLQYPQIETGGDLFGLWQNESEVVVQLAIGPGENCRRTTTAFFQDERYLGAVGNHLTSTEGLCNIGEWHSHHCLNLPEPSAGDKQTIWRHLPTYKLDRFLLFIVTIDRNNGHPDIHSFMFTSPENASRRGGMFPTGFVILPGPNPYRQQEEILKKLSQGAEGLMVRGALGGEKETKKEKRKRKKEERKRKKEEKKLKKQEEKDKKVVEKRKKKEKENENINSMETEKRGWNRLSEQQDGKEKPGEVKSEKNPEKFVTPDYWGQEDRMNAEGRHEGSSPRDRHTYC